jgi:hypothetical protein
VMEMRARIGRTAQVEHASDAEEDTRPDQAPRGCGARPRLAFASLIALLSRVPLQESLSLYELLT